MPEISFRASWIMSTVIIMCAVGAPYIVVAITGDSDLAADIRYDGLNSCLRILVYSPVAGLFVGIAIFYIVKHGSR